MYESENLTTDEVRTRLNQVVHLRNDITLKMMQKNNLMKNPVVQCYFIASEKMSPSEVSTLIEILKPLAD